MAAGENGSKSRGGGARKVYNALRTEILTLVLEPGELLDEARIGERFGLSRSPVREALIRLSSEGLVTTLPNKSTQVAPLQIEDFPQYLDALDLLQRAVTRLAAKQRRDADLVIIKSAQGAFEDALGRRDALAMIEANRDFHVAIGEAARNRYLADSYARILDEGRRILRIYFRSYGDAVHPEFADEHPRIIAAIEARDEDLAERLAHAHARQMGERFLQYLRSRHTADISVAGGVDAV